MNLFVLSSDKTFFDGLAKIDGVTFSRTFTSFLRNVKQTVDFF